MRKQPDYLKQLIFFIGYVVLCMSTTSCIYLLDYQYHTQYTMLQFVARFTPLLVIMFMVIMCFFDAVMALLCEYMIRKHSGGRSVNVADWYIERPDGDSRVRE